MDRWMYREERIKFHTRWRKKGVKRITEKKVSKTPGEMLSAIDMERDYVNRDF